MLAVSTEILFLHCHRVCGCYLCLLTDCTCLSSCLLFCSEPPWPHMHLTGCKMQCQLLLTCCASCALVQYYLYYFYFSTSYSSRNKNEVNSSTISLKDNLKIR